MHKVYIKFEQAILYYGLLGCMGFISRVNWDSQPSVWDSKILVSWGIQLHLHDTTMKLWKNESVDAQPRLANSLVCLSPELCSERQASVESQKKKKKTKPKLVQCRETQQKCTDWAVKPNSQDISHLYGTCCCDSYVLTSQFTGSLIVTLPCGLFSALIATFPCGFFSVQTCRLVDS